MTSPDQGVRYRCSGAVLLASAILPSAVSAGGIYVPMKGATAAGLGNVGMASLARDGSPDLVRPQGFEDTFTVGLAAQYAVNPRWTLHGGIQYDESPTTDALRNTSIPDSDLIWFGLGASCRVSERLNLDVGYVHGVFERADPWLIPAFHQELRVAVVDVVGSVQRGHIAQLIPPSFQGLSNLARGNGRRRTSLLKYGATIGNAWGKLRL